MDKHTFVTLVILSLGIFVFQFSLSAQAFQLLDIEKETEIKENKEFNSKEYSQGEELISDSNAFYFLNSLCLPFYLISNVVSSSNHSLLISSHKSFIHSPPISF